MVSLITQQAWLNRLPLLVVTSGSAIGREGAMILLAALAASCFAQRLTPRQEWKLWIACGAAAGMAAAYRAPLAGSLFIAEVLFGTMMLASRPGDYFRRRGVAG